MELTIYEFDKNNFFTRRIEAESADISSINWSLKNVKKEINALLGRCRQKKLCMIKIKKLLITKKLG